MSPRKFDDFLNNDSKLKSPNPASDKAETRACAEKNGIIQRGEARLSSTGKPLEKQLNMEVDLSVVRRGGNFDGLNPARGQGGVQRRLRRHRRRQERGRQGGDRLG